MVINHPEHCHEDDAEQMTLTKQQTKGLPSRPQHLDKSISRQARHVVPANLSPDQTSALFSQQLQVLAANNSHLNLFQMLALSRLDLC